MNVRRLGLLLGGGTLAGGGLAGGIVGVVLWMSADMRAVTHQFLGAMRTGEVGLAYSVTSMELRSQVPPHALGSYVDQNAPDVRRSTSEWINGFSGGLDRQCMETWLYGDAVQRTSVYLILVKEGGLWRVTRVAQDEPSECDVD